MSLSNVKVGLIFGCIFHKVVWYKMAQVLQARYSVYNLVVWNLISEKLHYFMDYSLHCFIIIIELNVLLIRVTSRF